MAIKLEFCFLHLLTGNYTGYYLANLMDRHPYKRLRFSINYQKKEEKTAFFIPSLVTISSENVFVISFLLSLH